MRPSIHLPMILTCLLPVSLAVGGELPSRFTLGQYVPDNVWMYMHFVHNPERAWIEAQWAEVFDALKNSGIDRDVTSMFVSLLSEADRAEAEATLERVTAAIKRVRWGDLIGREMVFAERIGAEPPGFDYFLLAHGTSGSAEHNMTALVSILTELSTLTDKALLTNAKQHGAEVWALAPCKENPRGPTVSVHLFRKGDIIGLSLGCGNLKGILKLMEGTSEGRPVVATPRFKQALRQVKTPEDGLMFFDVQHLLRNLDDLMNYFVDSEVRENGEVPQEVIAVKRLIELAGVVDYGAVSIETDGRREFTHSLTVFQPNSESSPVAQIFLNRKPFERFDQYVPADATSFSVTGFIDLERLYELAVDFIQKNIPGGTEKIEKWNTVLAEFGFDPQRDLFSWWSGEMVSVTVPAAVVTPMGNTTSVLMIRVKDSELADQKLGAAIDWLSTLLADAHNHARSGKCRRIPQDHGSPVSHVATRGRRERRLARCGFIGRRDQQVSRCGGGEDSLDRRERAL